MLVPAMELLGTDTAHRTTGAIPARDLTPRSPDGDFKKPSPSTPLASGRASTRFKDPHCWPNWSSKPAASADPNGNPTARAPLSPAAVESEPRNTEAAAAAPRTGTGEKENRDLFLTPSGSAGSSEWGAGESGWGTWVWDQNRTLPPEIARRRPSGDLPLSSLLASVMAFCFGPCSVWFLASTWSVGLFPFCSVFSPFSLCPVLHLFQKIMLVCEKKRKWEKQIFFERERVRGV